MQILINTVFLHNITFKMINFEEVTIKDVKLKTAELVKGMRKNRGISQLQLAEELELSRITIQNLEAGRNTTLDTLLKAFQYFDCLDKFHQFIAAEIQNNDTPSLY